MGAGILKPRVTWEVLAKHFSDRGVPENEINQQLWGLGGGTGELSLSPCSVEAKGQPGSRPSNHFKRELRIQWLRCCVHVGRD